MLFYAYLSFLWPVWGVAWSIVRWDLRVRWRRAMEHLHVVNQMFVAPLYRRAELQHVMPFYFIFFDEGSKKKIFCQTSHVSLARVIIIIDNNPNINKLMI